LGRHRNIGYRDRIHRLRGRYCALVMAMNGLAQKYREEAERLRREAERASSPDMRRLLLNIASQYDQLADSAERQSRPN
jgi:hypothetical protein